MNPPSLNAPFFSLSIFCISFSARLCLSSNGFDYYGTKEYVKHFIIVIFFYVLELTYALPLSLLPLDALLHFQIQTCSKWEIKYLIYVLELVHLNLPHQVNS